MINIFTDNFSYSIAIPLSSILSPLNLHAFSSFLLHLLSYKIIFILSNLQIYQQDPTAVLSQFASLQPFQVDFSRLVGLAVTFGIPIEPLLRRLCSADQNAHSAEARNLSHSITYKRIRNAVNSKWCISKFTL